MRDDDETKREGIGERATRATEHLPRGTLVGRYVVLDLLGEGGMGVVYEAFDPELDRKVAIKLLQAGAGGSSGGDQAWILREAQALARLSHPNVVAVHDVGTLPGDRVFVAMELVAGQTLRSWLKEPRRWQDVLPVMRAAGAGLAAAHAAGLVHRDFKPDNVVVGEDGRVRVMDFGLARLQGEARASSPEIEAKSPLSQDLTMAGSLVGTPAYMSPQLYAGQAADAKSDQFAFGVALYESLYRLRPYAKDDLIAKDVPPPRPRTPPDIGVPAAVQRVVMRAIAVDADARFPSMDALLAGLAIDPGAARRRWWLAGGGVLALGATAAAAVVLSGHHEAVCSGIERRLAGTWDPAVKDAVHRAFVATKLEIAPHAFAAVEHALDGYAAEWTTSAVDSCRATRTRGEQTEEVMALRGDCLDLRLDELRALAQMLAKADDRLLPKAEHAARSLDPVSECSQVAQLRAPGLPPPEARTKVAGVREKLADAKAAIIAGRLGDSIIASTAAAEAAKAIPFAPIESEARMVQGLSMTLAGNSADGLAVLSDAAWTALRSKRDEIAAMSALYAAQIMSETFGKIDEAKLWLALGTATAARVGVDQRLVLQQLEVEGVVKAQQGDLAGAAAAHEKALELAKVLYETGPMLAKDESLLASTYAKMGAYAKAAPHYERAVESLAAAEGKDHPDLATMLSGLGVCYAHAGDLPKAREVLQRSLAIRERAFGADSPMLVPALNNMADLLVKHGGAAEAMPLLDRGMAIAEKLGRSHPIYHTVATTRGEALYAQHLVAEARTELDAVIALEDKAHSPMLVTTLTSRAAIELGEHAWAAAAAFDRRAVEVAEAAGGKDAAELWEPLAGLGEAQIGLAKPAEAKALLERAIAIAEKVQVSVEDLAPVRAALAGLK